MENLSSSKKITDNKDLQESEASSTNKVRVGNSNFYIMADMPCPEYASVGTQAFKAKDVVTGDDYLALLTGDVAIPRFSYMPTLETMRSPRMLALHYHNVIQMPTDGNYYVACIFDIPQGSKVMAEQNSELTHIIPHEYSNKLLSKNIIDPILKLLRELKKIDITHGAINLSNIYAVEDEGELHLQLGECVTSAHSYTQHALFEPINRGLAHQAARGRTTEKDDLYSLGISLALMAIRHNPFKDMSEDEIITKKTEMGSYMFIARDRRLPSGISEFLRGVLNDEYSSRWSLEEAIKWVEGSRMTIRTPRPAHKASRPYIFMDKKYSYVHTLVNAFVNNPSYAISTLREKKFREWLHRNITDKSTIANFDKNFGQDKDLVEAYENREDLMLVHACIALVPEAPIRYKGVAVLPGGFGMGLAHAIIHKQDINPYLDILRRQIFNYWFDMQHIHIAEISSISVDLEKAKAFLRQKVLARGIERVVYMLCSEAYCLSPIIKHLYVRDAVDLLVAFENLAKNNALPNIDNFFDRHILAFLMERDPKVIEPQLSLIVSNIKSQKIVGLLRSFATMQKLASGKSTPNLFKWFLNNIEPAIDRIHDRRLRKVIMNRLKSFSGKKSFTELLEVVDDIDMIKEDTKGFVLAKNAYREMEHDKMLLKAKLQRGYSDSISSGREVAMVVSVILAIITIVMILFFHFNMT